MNDDWVLTFTFDVHAPIEDMDRWETELDDATVAYHPHCGSTVTIYTSGEQPIFTAVAGMLARVTPVVHADVIGIEAVRESEYVRLANEPTIPMLVNATGIAETLRVSRQRVHQLRALPSFPAPLIDFGNGALWDSAAIQVFKDTWKRRNGRPPKGDM